MNWIAIKMLTGNRGKYLGIILGIAFASLLIAQQAAIFCGLMLQTCGKVYDIKGADIWVMDPNVRFIDNHFSTRYFPDCGRAGPITSFDKAGEGNIWEGNIWHETGKTIP